jgi:hypothetical protein
MIRQVQDAENMAISQDERRRLFDLNATAEWLFIVLLSGFGLLAARSASSFLANGIFHHHWEVTGQAYIEILWAFAWFAAGFVFGFLFGIPKVLQTAIKPQVPVTAGLTTNDNSKASPASGESTVPYQLRVNTNLEEISDWLTKILVGATLTQLVKIPGLVGAAATYMGKGLGGPSPDALAAAILIFFSTTGFFSGYVLTRMFFSGAFSRSDQQNLVSGVLSVVNLKQLKDLRVAIGEDRVIDSAVRETAEKSRSVKITGALSGTVAGAVAKGAMVTGDSSRAVQAAAVALANNPDDPRTHLDYAVALYKANAGSAIILMELEKAHDLLTNGIDPAVKEDIYNSIVYLALYQAAPEGFTKAIEYAQEFVKTSSPSGSGLWINLACAYGQQYSFLKSASSNVEELKTSEQNALSAVKKALETDPSSKIRLRELSDRSAKVDNDLSDLAQDNSDLRSILGIA